MHRVCGDVSGSDESPLTFYQVGDEVDYLVASLRCWAPARVVCVAEESGAITISIRKDPLSFKLAHKCLRRRAKPGSKQLRWLGSILRQGRLREEAERIYREQATIDACTSTEETPERLGKKVESLLGVSGAVWELKYRVEKGAAIDEDAFCSFFWEIATLVHKKWGHAVATEKPPLDPRKADSVYRFFRGNLGEGAQGTVFKVKHVPTGVVRAVKRCVVPLDAKAFDADSEIGRLCAVDHPHIVKLYDYWRKNEEVFFAMDYCPSGDMMGVIKAHCQANRSMPEDIVSNIMQQILRATSHLHAHGFLHLDIKPGNVVIAPVIKTTPPCQLERDSQPELPLLLDPHQAPHVRIIDLGLSTLFRPGCFPSRGTRGTPMYASPELLHGIQTPAADVFSCGVMLYMMLTLGKPFDEPFAIATSGARIAKEARMFYKGRPKIRAWSTFHGDVPVGESARTLTESMLHLKRESRISCVECLCHDFLARDEFRMSIQGAPRKNRIMDYLNFWNNHPPSLLPARQPLPDKVVAWLRKAPGRSILYKSVALAIARRWPANQWPTANHAFQQLDSRARGRLDTGQIVSALVGSDVPLAEAEDIADAMDLTRDGWVNWTEFVATCIDLRSADLEVDLRELFESVAVIGEEDVEVRHPDGRLETVMEDVSTLNSRRLSMLVAVEHLHENNCIKEMACELARIPYSLDPACDPVIDWDTFLEYFRSER